ncbi:MAG TPA: AraC family transcriptional regulator [Terriglobales bacterium]|nr:AraC family transcriptional regulator [Terriglobales bacterium]
MPKRKTKHQSQFHRSQIGRAQRYIRLNIGEPLSLSQIAREAGSSSYHFARLFLAYTAETPFDFLRRIRLITALRMLQEDPKGSVTEIALNVGYETPSAFNKVFKKTLNMSPRDFRNLGKDGQYEVIYRLSRPHLEKEIPVNLTPKFEIVERPLTHYVFLEKHGPFAEVAPPTWEELFPLLNTQLDHKNIISFLGLSGTDKTKPGEDAMIYEAGVGVSSAPEKPLRGLQYKKIKAGKYARFLLSGPYSQIWVAFNQIFKTMGEATVELRPEFCIENYLNDPKVTPEEQLKTELLVPTAD